jgi:acyl dehydratase
MSSGPPAATLTDANAAAFQTVSIGNHYDAECAPTHGHVAPVVHGLQVLAFTAPGATLFPHFIGEVFISFLELSCTFLATVHNQRGQLVLSGQHKYLLRRQRAVRNGDG